MGNNLRCATTREFSNIDSLSLKRSATTNLPELVREWVLTKYCSQRASSGDGGRISETSSISQNLRSNESNGALWEQWKTYFGEVCKSNFPIMMQPKCVSKTAGSREVCCLLFPIKMAANTWAPSNMSIFAGILNLSSASWRFSKCAQWLD